MTVRKDNSMQDINLHNEKSGGSPLKKINSEDEMDSRNQLHKAEEGDEDYDDKELSDEDFAIDGDEEDDNDEF